MELFVSNFVNKIDKKGRVSFPSLFRNALPKGKKNEIRRIFKFSNIKLISLKRVKFGEITLGNLKEGFWKELSEKDKKYLEKISRK